MSEKPLERLNYYNGQRLTASELKLEQEYHIRVRRWLNKSLYSPGIARGLEVRAEANSPRVVVSPGLALDAEGREIILWEKERVPVTRKHHPKGGGSEAEVEGPYLVIRYNDELMAEEHESCSLQAGGYQQSAAHPAWGGPSRVRSKPVFAWRDFLPHESSGEIILAQVELDDNCQEVHQINVGVRRYVGAASAAKVRQYALEGERDIDSHNPGKIYFHVRGRQPTAVTLYLRAEKFSTLYYTELGEHKHALTVEAGTSTGPATPPIVLDHFHTLSTVDTGAPVNPSVSFTCRTTDVDPVGATDRYVVLGTMEAAGRPRDRQFLSPIIGQLSITHTHNLEIGAKTDDSKQLPDKHTHPFTPDASVDMGGVKDPVPPSYTARSREPPLTYVADLQVYIDGTDETHNQTKNILRQLQNAHPTINWETVKLGGESANHPLVEKGTGEIKLDFLSGVYFDEGEHYIELRVAKGGGRILYNLYVE